MKNFIAFLVLSASLCFAQMTIQFQNQGTPIGTFKKWLPINCTTNLTCAFSGGIITISATGGSATAGGSNTQVQYNSSNALAGSADFTIVGHTLAGGASAIFDLHSASSFLLPGALSTGCVTVTTSTGAISSVVCPQTIANASHQWLNSYTASTGAFTQTQPAISDLTATFSLPLNLSTNTLSCATCGVTGSPLSQFAATTSAQLAGVLSDETGTSLAVFNTSPLLVTPKITTINDGNGNPFLLSSATASAVDSVTVTNAATANPATVAITASGSDSNINLNLVSKGTGTVQCNGGSCGAGGGANTALSNLASVAVNLALLPGADNSISLDGLSNRYINFWSSGVFGWTNGSGTADTGLSRDSAGVVDVGNGTAGNTSGTIKATTFQSTGSNGGYFGTEGTGNCTAALTTDCQYPDSTLHDFHLNVNNVDLGGAVGGGTAAVTSGDLASYNGTTGFKIQDSNVIAANVTTQTSNGASNQVCTYTGANKVCVPGTVTGAMMTNATVTATQLAAQYSKGSCTEVWGGSGTSFAMTAGDDAISNNSCYNDSGVTRTITALKCRSDNAANTTVLTPTFGAAGTGTAILTGTVTCGNSYAYSATGTVNNSAWTTGTGIDPGMSTVGNATSIAMIVEYTY